MGKAEKKDREAKIELAPPPPAVEARGERERGIKYFKEREAEAMRMGVPELRGNYISVACAFESKRIELAKAEAERDDLLAALLAEREEARELLARCKPYVEADLDLSYEIFVHLSGKSGSKGGG